MVAAHEREPTTERRSSVTDDGGVTAPWPVWTRERGARAATAPEAAMAANMKTAKRIMSTMVAAEPVDQLGRG